MAIYTVQAPDGSTIRIEGPDGASDAEIIAQAQRLWQAEQRPQTERPSFEQRVAEERKAMVDGMSGRERFVAGMGKAFSDIGTGVKQLFDGVRLSRGDATAALDLLKSQERVAENRALEQPLMDTRGGFWGNVAGNVAASVPLAMAAPATLPSMGLQGAVMGALQPTAPGENAVENAALGGAFGVAAPWALGKTGNAVRRVFSPAGVAVEMPATNAMREGAADLLRQYGINSTVAQRTGSQPLQALESVLAGMPSTSASVMAERAAQQTSFNRAVTGLLGEASDSVDDAVMRRAFERLSGGYQEIAKGVTLMPGDEFLGKLAQVESGYSKYLPSTVKDAYKARLDDLVDLVGKPLSGERYQAIRSELGKAAAGTNDTGYKDALKGLRRALDDEFAAAASPEQLAQKLKLDQQYRAAKILDDASLLTTDKTGISAAKAANKLEREIRKGPVMPEMAGLLKAGGQIIPDRIPNSGTAQRNMIQNLVTGQAAPGLLGLGTALATDDPTAGLYAAGAYYLGPRAALAMLRNPTGARWIGGRYALPAATGRTAEILGRAPALAAPGLLGVSNGSR